MGTKERRKNKSPMPGYSKVIEESANWYGEYRDHNEEVKRVPLCADKSAAQIMLGDKVRKAARHQAGMVDPYEEANKKPLGEHLAAYRKYLESKGNDPEYVDQAAHRLELLTAGCEFKRLPDIEAGHVVDWLQAIKDSGRSHATFNLYLAGIKGFCRWAVKDRRMPDDPIAHLSKVNEEVDVRVERRNLSPEEFACLIDTAKGSPDVFRKLNGEDRAMLSTVAAYTGLRAGEPMEGSLGLTTSPIRAYRPAYRFLCPQVGFPCPLKSTSVHQGDRPRATVKKRKKPTKTQRLPRLLKRRARDSNPQPHYWGTTFPVWPLAIRLPSGVRHPNP